MVVASGAQGAGVRILSCSPKIERSRITGNRLGAGNWAYGAGVYCSNSSAVFDHVLIDQNATDSASWGYGGGVYLTGSGHPVLRNVTVAGNTVRSDSWNYGPGVYCESAQATFVNVKILNNAAADSAIWYYGGGLYLEDCVATLTNVLIAGNTMGAGGNFYSGGGLYLRRIGSNATCQASLTHVTVAGNYRANGLAIGGSGFYANANTSLTAVNCIFWNQNSGAEVINAGTVAITYSDVRGSYPGTGNLSLFPAFVSPSDWHLALGSPCLNAGTAAGAPPFDLDDQPRPLPAGTNPDMGCYETDQSLSVAGSSGPAAWSVFPNPATGTVQALLPSPAGRRQTALLSDLAGRTLQTHDATGLYRLAFSVGGLPPGIYLLTLFSDGVPAGSVRLAVQ
jgi:hypothetical protein